MENLKKQLREIDSDLKHALLCSKDAQRKRTVKSFNIELYSLHTALKFARERLDNIRVISDVSEIISHTDEA